MVLVGNEKNADALFQIQIFLNNMPEQISGITKNKEKILSLPSRITVTIIYFSVPWGTHKKNYFM